MLRVLLLGRFEVWRDVHLITSHEWRTRKARTLLKVFVHERGRPVTFERLCELLWPNKNLEAAANCLHTNLAYLRHALAGTTRVGRTGSYIQRVGLGYAFVRSSAWIDVDEFLAASRAGRVGIREGRLEDGVREMERAAGLYRGDYLEEDIYEEWPTETREWLREQYLMILVTLGARYIAMRCYNDAADAARRILERDPYREQGVRLLMICALLSGREGQSAFHLPQVE